MADDADDVIVIDGPAPPRPRSRSRQSGTGMSAPLPVRLLGGIWLDLMLARFAPHDEAHAGPCGVAERHRRARVRVHRHRAECAVRFRGPLSRSPRPSFSE